MKFRDLNEKEIEVRVGNIGKFDSYNGWATLLLYKNARVDMIILDETVGAENWQRRHYEQKGNLYCSVGIWSDKRNEWIWKDDCGTESFSDKEKGEASDSFKRACVNWGIGRELYTVGEIFVKIPIKENAKGKIIPNGKFEIEKIKIENKEIVGLSILFFDNDNNKKRIFLMKPKQIEV